MSKRAALKVLASFALPNTNSDDDRLAVYDAISTLGEEDVFALLAQRAAEAIRVAQNAQRIVGETQEELFRAAAAPAVKQSAA